MYNSDPPSNPLHAWQQWAIRIEQRMQEQQQTIERLEHELQRIKQQLAMQEHSSPIYHVEKIEYHFDQLKVDTLEGSLQIGLSTSNPEQLPMMIEDFVMQQQNANAAPPFPYNTNGNDSANPSFKRSTPSSPRDVAKPNTRLKNRLHQQYAAGSAEPKNKRQSTVENDDTSSSNGQLINTCIEHIRLSLQQRFDSYIDRQSSLLQLEINEEHKKLIIEDLDRQLPARVHYYFDVQQSKNESIEIEELQQQLIKLTLADIESAIDQYLYRLSQENKE